MRFLADQNVFMVTVSFLKSLGHDVVSAAEDTESAHFPASMSELT